MPVAPERLNAVGDFVLAHTEEFRALADADRLSVFDEVRRIGPASAAELAGRLGADASAVDGHLRALEEVGLVGRESPGADRWFAAVRGIYFEIPDEPEAQRAARDLSNTMLTKYAVLPARWVDEHEPRLELEWARAAGLFNARVAMTFDELQEIQEQLERLLEPYTNRPEAAAPAGAAPVRILTYLLPEAAPSAPPA